MDLFDLNNNFSSKTDELLNADKKKVLIWQKKVRRTVNTYALIPESKSILKEYHKSLKKAWGCNGSLKMNEVFGRVYDKTGKVDKSTGRNIKELVFHLSKDCLYELIDFLKSKGFNEDDIEIKDL